jgi:hypothetical protein
MSQNEEPTLWERIEYPEPPKPPVKFGMVPVALILVCALFIGVGGSFLMFRQIGTSTNAKVADIVATDTPAFSPDVTLTITLTDTTPINTPAPGQNTPTGNQNPPTNTPTPSGPPLLVSPTGEQAMDCTSFETRTVTVTLRNNAGQSIGYEATTSAIGNWSIGGSSANPSQGTLASGASASIFLSFYQSRQDGIVDPNTLMKATWYVIVDGTKSEVGTTTIRCNQ